MDKALQAAQVAPEMLPLLLLLLKFGVTGFKIGKTIEGAFDELAAKMQAQPPSAANKPDPEMEKVKMQAQAEQAKQQAENQREQARLQAEQQREAMRLQMEGQFKAQEQKQQMDAQRQQFDMQFERFKALLEAKTKIEVAEITAGATVDSAQISGAQQATQ